MTVAVGAGEGGQLLTCCSKGSACLQDVSGVFNCLTVRGELAESLSFLGPMAAQGFRTKNINLC